MITGTGPVALAGVVTRSPARRADVAADWPGVPVFDSLADPRVLPTIAAQLE